MMASLSRDPKSKIFRIHFWIGPKQHQKSLKTTDAKEAKEKYRGKFIKGRTAKKEVETFRSVWYWCVLHGLLQCNSPTRGLKYEKADEKPPFMTWAEIEQRIARGGLTQKQIKELWNCLF